MDFIWLIVVFCFHALMACLKIYLETIMFKWEGFFYPFHLTFHDGVQYQLKLCWIVSNYGPQASDMLILFSIWSCIFMLF